LLVQTYKRLTMACATIMATLRNKIFLEEKLES